jgi:hypothetical protein
MELVNIFGITIAAISILIAISSLLLGARVRIKTRNIVLEVRLGPSNSKRKVIVAPDDEKSVVDFVDTVKSVANVKPEKNEPQD